MAQFFEGAVAQFKEVRGLRLRRCGGSVLGGAVAQFQEVRWLNLVSAAVHWVTGPEF